MQAASRAHNWQTFPVSGKSKLSRRSTHRLGDRCEGQKNTRITLMTRIGLFTDFFDPVISLRGDADGF